jgi:hypothetical protein
MKFTMLIKTEDDRQRLRGCYSIQNKFKDRWEHCNVLINITEYHFDDIVRILIECHGDVYLEDGDTHGYGADTHIICRKSDKKQLLVFQGVS